MAQFDISIKRNGGFSSLADTMAHHRVVDKLKGQIAMSESLAADLREADKVEIGQVGSELYKDLAAGKGHVIMLSQPEDRPLMGAELQYAADNSTRYLQVEMGSYKLTQSGGTYKLQEGDVTTYFRLDKQREVLTILDKDSDVPRIFGGVDPAKLTAGTLQLGQPILIF